MIDPQWSIRLSRREDAGYFVEVEADALASLRNAPELADIPTIPPRPAAGYEKMIGQRHCLTVIAEEQIVGFAATSPVKRELHLHQISVARAFQQQRIGSTLMRAVQIDARNAGHRAITLQTFRSPPWNAPFFAQHGFVEIDDLAAYPRLAAGMDAAVAAGLARDDRCAMIAFLD